MKNIVKEFLAYRENAASKLYKEEKATGMKFQYANWETSFLKVLREDD
jgi:hypothetical protein